MGPIEHAKLINDSIGHYCASDSLYNIAHLQIANQMASDGPVAFDMLRNLGLLSGMIGIVVAGVLFIISIAISKFRIEYKFLKWLFLISWLFAFAIYDVGMCIDNRALTLLLNAPMAMLHAFGTFVLSSDVSEIHSQFFDSTLFMALFSASHALSAFVSALFLIKVFGFNIVQRIRLYLESLRPCQREETYVFWGSNSASYRLIESIKKHFEGNDSRYRIIVVKISDTSEESSETTIGINKIFEFISIKNSELQQLQNLGCFMTHSSSSDLDSSSNFSADNNEPFRDIINGKLHLRSLTKILLEKTSDTIHFLLLSDDENDNLHDVSVLLNDTTLNKFANSNSQNGKQRKIILYCHARYNGVHRVIEDCHRSNNMEVRVIDSSHINVELLKKNEDVLPVNFVDVAADASVSSPFNAMVIGFSEVGQDATRFLYEFGSFVKSGGNSDHAARSSFHLDVVDNRMEEKAGAFIMNAPAISPSLSFVAELNNPKTLIEFHNEDCRSVSFSDD